MPSFYSNGKLLLTGEYAVLDGALSLAIPTMFGQSMYVKQTDSGNLNWKSLDHTNKIWFESQFELSEISNIHFEENASSTEAKLISIFRSAIKQRPEIFNSYQGLEIETQLNFPRNWGLGSSSTLINNLATWLQIDPYELLWDSLGGSGYDIACARNHQPILYKLIEKKPTVTPVAFNPSFKDHLFFIYLNEKQNSREGISHYQNQAINKMEFTTKISDITKRITASSTLSEFQSCMEEHEALVSKTIKLKTIKERFFADYEGSVKSLGAWGGDFILVTGNLSSMSYFENKGFKTIVPFSKMVK